MCPFVEKKKNSVGFSFTYKYKETKIPTPPFIRDVRVVGKWLKSSILPSSSP